MIAITYGNGTIRWINGYDEWGIPNAAGNTGRFQYTGQIWIAELGMYHYKARIYSFDHLRDLWWGQGRFERDPDDSVAASGAVAGRLGYAPAPRTPRRSVARWSQCPFR